MKLDYVISGGQSGADQAFLLAAKDAGIPTGGTAPRGWRTDEGPAPWLADFGLVESQSSFYPARTEANVRAADATVLFGRLDSRGTALTVALCQRHKKPHLHLSWPSSRTPEEAWARLTGFLEQYDARILNGAGNRERTNPGIGAACRALLVPVFAALRHRS